jgi:hypothetical protein
VFTEQFPVETFIEDEFLALADDISIEPVDVGTEDTTLSSVDPIEQGDVGTEETTLSSVEPIESGDVGTEETTLSLVDPIESGDVGTEETTLNSVDPTVETGEVDAAVTAVEGDFSVVIESSDTSAEVVTDSELDVAAGERANDSSIQVTKDNTRSSADKDARVAHRKAHGDGEAKLSDLPATKDSQVVRNERQLTTDRESTSQQANQWQRLRELAALAAREIAASGVANHAVAFQQTGVIPATTGSIAGNWATTIAAFAHSAVIDQLNELTSADIDDDQAFEETPSPTYAQVTSAAGTLLIGGTVLFQTLQQRRNDKLKRQRKAAKPLSEKETWNNYTTADGNRLFDSGRPRATSHQARNPR